MKMCVIFNPAARGDKAAHFRSRLNALSRECVLKPTSGPGNARILAAGAVSEGFETIVAAGGDGTLNEVLNGIAAAADGLQRTRLAVLPLGTVNVFAKEIHMPSTVDAAWAAVRNGRESRMDAPFADFVKDGRTVRRYFIQLAGAGLDSRAIETTDLDLKKKIGPLAYVAAGFRAMNGPQPQITVSGGRRTVSGELVLLGNGRYYGGRFPMFPDASPGDGLLDATVFPRVDWQTLARTGWSWLTRDFPPPQTLRLQSRAFRLESAAPMPFELDGENVGELPASFSMLPGALRVVTPP